ncbi:MAG: AI-2E family transporter [Proteobacteria bacterium]|nr:MAG: AI-2E family transporter [Pseudomonadota bacterium]
MVICLRRLRNIVGENGSLSNQPSPVPASHPLNQRWWVFLSLVIILYYAKVVFIPIVVSVFAAMLLWPLVNWLENFKVPRGLASFGVTFFFFVSLALVGWLIYLCAAQLAMTLPLYTLKLSQVVGHMRDVLHSLESQSSQFMPRMNSDPSVQKVEVISAMPAWSSWAMSGAGSVSELFSFLFIMPLLLIYFFLDKENLVESSSAVFGKFSYLPKLYADLPLMLRAFVTGNIVAAVLLSSSQALVLFLLGYNNWAALGVVSGILNLVPVVGTILAILLPLGQALVQFEDSMPLIVMAGTFTLLHFIANNILLPWIVGIKTNVNAPTLLIGLLFWSWLWGPVGFLLAIPMTAVVKIFLESHRDTLAIANMMASRPTHLLKFKKLAKPVKPLKPNAHILTPTGNSSELPKN